MGSYSSLTDAPLYPLGKYGKYMLEKNPPPASFLLRHEPEPTRHFRLFLDLDVLVCKLQKEVLVSLF